MRKPGQNGGNKPTWKNGNDYRGGDNETRRSNFKPNHRNKRHNKNWASNVEAHLQDEDIDMGGAAAPRNSNRKIHRGRRPGRSELTAGDRRKLLDGPIHWYRVYLPFGNKYDKALVQKALMMNTEPLPFWPIMWETNGNKASFYIDDRKLAEKLLELDGHVQMPDGFNLFIKVNCNYPNPDVNSSLREKITTAMSRRYNPATRALDLVKFHYDPELQNYFCALFKPVILMAVIDLMAENIPEIEALNLGSNKIATLGPIKKALERLPNLKVVHLGDNMLRDISQLDLFIGLPIVDLMLTGNPLCAKYKDQESYIGEVRKRFPKVLKLDGVDLPPPISFDLADDVPLPDAAQTFLCNQEGAPIVRQFLEQYFQIYDADNRQPLLQAYHESALYSLTMSYTYPRDKNRSCLDWYMSDNRNLLKVTDTERRSKLLRQGRMSIVGFLQEMPDTKHDIHSFKVDLVLFTPQMIALGVSGMFKELSGGHRVTPIRSFFRTFVIVPVGAGFCITNETVHITNATDVQAKGAFKAMVAPPPTPVSSPVAAASAPSDVTKQRMIEAVCQQSGMNQSWSQKCLSEVNWDFNVAIATFNTLNAQGVIPREAFIK